MALDATVGGASSNSYLTLAEADTYFDDRAITAWTGSTYTDDQKEAALIQATSWIDNTFQFIGEIDDTTQRLAWPRDAAYDKEGRLVGDTTHPEQVKNAVCEAALAYLVEGSLQATTKRGGLIKREKVGDLEVEYMGGAAGATTYPQATAYLKGLTVSQNKVRRS